VPESQKNTQKWWVTWLGVIAGLSAPLWVSPDVIAGYLFFCGGLCGIGVGASVANNKVMR
jgi:hypothetical protein